jgi:hypothetical protein
MKSEPVTRKLLFIPVYLLLNFLYTGCSSGKQPSSAAAQQEISQAINNDRWVFTAYNVNPQYGRSRNVNGLYEVKCTKDKLIVSLPYFGRLYSGAGLMNNQSVLDFTSSDFSFDKQKGKNDGSVVTIKPNDYREVQSLVFTLFESGTAQLNVMLTNRSAISFTGIVGPLVAN